MRFLVLLPLLGLVYQAFAQPLDFEKLTTQHGLSHSTVYSICQDGAGYLWFGTKKGLNRYDSYEIQSYYQGDRGLPHDGISALAAVGDTGLYVGTFRGLVYYDYRLDTFRSVNYQGESLGRIHDVEMIDPHAAIICSKKGIYLCEGPDSVKLLKSKVRPLQVASFKAGLLWVALGKGGMLLMDLTGQVVRQFQLKDEKGLSQAPPGLLINCLYTDPEHQTWVATSKGLWTYDITGGEFVKVQWQSVGSTIESQFIRTIISDEAGNLWLGTEAGLYIFNPGSGQTKHYDQGFTNQPGILSDKSVYSTYRCREGIMWIGTYFGGVNYAKPPQKTFHKMMADGGSKSLSGKAVSELIRTQEGELWIGTEDGGISVIDQASGNVKYHQHHPNDPHSLATNNVLSMLQDKQGNIWAGNFMGGLNRYDRQEKRFYHYTPRSKSRFSNDVFALFQDRQDLLWIGTRAGLFRYSYQQDSVFQVWPEIFGKMLIYDIGQDRNGDLWFCAPNKGIFRYDVGQDSLVRLRKKDYPGMSVSHASSFFQDSQGKIWLGTWKGGVMMFDPTLDTFTAFGRDQGMISNDVFQVLEDKQGRIWLSTNKGLCMYRPDVNQFTSFDVSYGLPNHQFNLRSSLALLDGTLLFGTVDGLCYFNPDSLQLTPPKPSLLFTDLRLFSKPVSPREGGLLTQHINFTDSLVVDYAQNVLGFDFTAIDHFASSNLHYAYYLEGFEQQWNYVGDQRNATYTNLSPGDYTLHLKVSLTPTGPPLAYRSLALTVRPPWWLTIWAMIGYCTLVGLLLFAYTRFSRFVHQQRLTLSIERMEKEQIKEINQHKINFFTYISHEFKTPLTLLISRLDKALSHNREENTHVQEQLVPMKRQVNRLQHLIMQLMEFRQMDAGHASLQLVEGDLVLFVRDTLEAFIPLFHQKQIKYRFACDLEVFRAYFDADKLTKILTNLLSNAIKHTGELGEVCLHMHILTEGSEDQPTYRLHIEVADTGVGMVQSESNKVFLPFYQTDPKMGSGSGIGLALVNSLITFLKGELKLVSSPDWGTRVRFNIPINIAPPGAYHAQEVIMGNKSLVIDHDLFEEEPLHESITEKSLPELLIVEDNKDLLRFLANHFGTHYRVTIAHNGHEALEKISARNPDLILSDVVMPQMGGLELCQHLKQDEHTSHIPLVLLSSRSEVEHKLKGLGHGADMYLPKPFNLREIELIVKNLLATRQNLREFFFQFGHWQGQEIPTNDRDQAFLQNILSLVKTHFSDPNFTVVKLAKEAGISRSLLHNKLRQIADLTASDLIKTIRLQHGAKLLLAGHNVSEAAYDSGFSDPGYFGRLFKKRFGINPSEYRESGANPKLDFTPVPLSKS